MDPNVAYRYWQQAIERDDMKTARAWAEGLYNWLGAGGFSPAAWEDDAPRLAQEFGEWCRKHQIGRRRAAW